MALISASRRTDVPAFYGDWLVNRLRAGFCLVKNPFRADQVRRVDLTPEAVDGLIFWTRHPAPFLRHLDEIDRLGIPHYFQVTVTGLPRILEPNLPPLEQCLRAFQDLGRRLGPERLIWRFDPLILSSLTPLPETLARFKGLAERLARSAGRVVVSRLELYAKARRRLSGISGLEVVDLKAEPVLWAELLGRLAQAAGEFGLEMLLCAGEGDFRHLGVRAGKCVDEEIFNQAYGLKLSLPKDPGQRRACLCAQSIDIGAYDSCPHGCLYCYATQSPEAARRRAGRHDPSGEALID